MILGKLEAHMGSGGKVVSVRTFYSDDQSSNSVVVYNFTVKIVVEKNENKQKEARIGPFTKLAAHRSFYFLKYSMN